MKIDDRATLRFALGEWRLACIRRHGLNQFEAEHQRQRHADYWEFGRYYADLPFDHMRESAGQETQGG